MGLFTSGASSWTIIACLILVVLPSPAAAFGAGNIPSIAQVEGLNFRHGDIEDMLKTIAFIRGHKWTSMMVKRVYFGNWLRDYSQAVDVGSLKGVSAPTIRILVWVLSFLSFGYATEEFEVTEERLGVYRPEEHIDNPKDYADNMDARQYDRRLRGPVQQVELDIDPNTGMKNYIANENGGWATSSGYVKFSMGRSIHFGRLYTSGSGHSAGKEADLCEALRCLGQGLHCLEDFGAHTNYVELALRELGYGEVFPHVGVSTEINVRGKHIYPLVTGTFGAVDFLHSVLGEATDHFTQTEIDEMNVALLTAEKGQAASSGQRGLFDSGGGLEFADLLSQIPGLGGGLASDCRNLQQRSAAQEYENSTRANVNTQFAGPPGGIGGPAGPGVPGMSESFDPVKTAKQIYPILEFRDKIVRAISTIIAKIPGLEAIVEKIGETLTVFVLSLLAPFVRPIIDAVSASLKKGSSEVVEASANSQFEPWNDPYSTNPTHSMLSKDHFSNKLNGVAGRVATTILQYVTPRILFAWQNSGVPVDEVMTDIMQVFHHPALRNEHCEVHRNMFATVRKWVEEQPDAHNLNNILSSSSVKAGHNHSGGGATGSKGMHDHSHASLGGHGKTSGSLWSEIQSRDLTSLSGGDHNPTHPSFATTPPYSGSPAFQSSPSPNYGYHNKRPGTSGSYGNDRPSSQGGHLAPSQDSYYQSDLSSQYQQENYGSGYQQQPQYGVPPPNQYNAPPYPTEQTYGGYNEAGSSHGGWDQIPPPMQESWDQRPPPPQDGWGQGPPGGWDQNSPQQPPYGQQYPPQQHQQPPYSGGEGGGGGFPGARYHGGD